MIMHNLVFCIGLLCCIVIDKRSLELHYSFNFDWTLTFSSASISKTSGTYTVASWACRGSLSSETTSAITLSLASALGTEWSSRLANTATVLCCVTRGLCSKSTHSCRKLFLWQPLASLEHKSNVEYGKFVKKHKLTESIFLKLLL